MSTLRDDDLEQTITDLLADPQYAGQPPREALAALFELHQDRLNQLERLTSISDGYQSVMRERGDSMAQRFHRQIRQLQKIVRISDHYQKMMRELNEALKVASTQDPLTGLPNRRLMLDRLTSESALAQRRHIQFTIAAVDIDHFKTVNDEFGHDVGDDVLVSVSRALGAGLRAYDLCARWGGEEFMVLLPETDGKTGVAIAERLRQGVQRLAHPEIPEGLSCSVSIGVAEHLADAQLQDTIKRADRALYQSKAAGRNHIILAN